MKNFQKADAMISSLLRLLKIPFNAKTEWICIKDEISYLQSYLSLMQYRYDKKNLTMEVHLEDDLKEVLIPRLILPRNIDRHTYCPLHASTSPCPCCADRSGPQHKENLSPCPSCDEFAKHWPTAILCHLLEQSPLRNPPRRA